MTTTLFGIKNCDTIKKAKSWLDSRNIDYVFHDYRQQGIEKDWLEQVEQALGWEALVNKRGTTYRQLTDEQKTGLNRESSIDLMLQHPAMIKRPILFYNQHYSLGFKASQYDEIFA